MIKNKLIRYLVVGGTSFVIEIACLSALHYIVNLSPTLSVAISFWIGFLVAFVLQKTITFKNNATSPKDLAAQISWYSLLVLFNYLFSLGMVYALSDNLNVIAIRTITIIIITSWNFVLYNRIFKQKHHANKSSKIVPTKTIKHENLAPYKKLVGSKNFAMSYFLLSIVILLITTLYWTLLSSRLQLANADQLVNSFLFNQLSSVRDALLPSAHSFLLKWPLFLVIGIKGATTSLFISATIILVSSTITCFAYILYKITKKPLLIGTVILALSSILLLVPTFPYGGGLLPVNMAMLATRNIEYIAYIGSLIYIIRAKKIISLKFTVGTLLLAAIIASDKLFLILSLGGALVMLVPYLIKRQWSFVRISINWLTASLAAAIIAFGTLYAISALHITHIVSQKNSLEPYGLINNFRDLVRGTIYAILGLLTNFGANPGYDAMQLSDLPKTLVTRLTGPSSITYLINMSLLVIGTSMVYLLLKATLTQKPKKASRPQTPVVLSIMLLASTIVSVLSFILTSHYYPADARYLTIALFAVIIGASTYANKKSWQPLFLVLFGIIMMIGIIAGSFSVLSTYRSDAKAVSIISERALAIHQALSSHRVDYLVGDYWRVMPVRLQPDNQFTIAPLENCTNYRQVLTSTKWQPNLKDHSFAYLLSLDRSLTNYPTCSIETIQNTYGRPTATALIAGTNDKPKELLLFYDNGINLDDDDATSLSTKPIDINNLPNTQCATGKTIMNVVAHQDDDLLFTSPDLLDTVHAGDCVRSVYLTAGDAGNDKYYWIGREEGSEAAYAQMASIPKEQWVQKTVKANNNAYFTISNHPKYKNLTLIFMQLPDGGLNGSGFPAYNNNSLYHMLNTTGTITSVDGQSTYTTSSLETTLETLMQKYSPTHIRTLSTYDGKNWPDHNDHHQANIITHQVFTKYTTANSIDSTTIPITDYMGYPVRLYPINVTGEPFNQKIAAFLAYAKQDGAVCQSLQDCANTPTYYGYLQRQYPL